MSLIKLALFSQIDKIRIDTKNAKVKQFAQKPIIPITRKGDEVTQDLWINS